ncbi:hypothetical protein ACWGJT_04320 [Streptomyces xantholiticus]
MEFVDDQEMIEIFYPDFDSNPPFVQGQETKSADFDFIRAIYQDGITFEAKGQSRTIALLPPGRSDPSEEAECQTPLAEHATASSGTLKRGDGFCVKTAEGRTAYIHVIDSPPALGTLRLRVTVWELPS